MFLLKIIDVDILCSHIANVKYLIAKMLDQKQEAVNL